MSIEKWHEIQELLASFFSLKYSFSIQREEIFLALFILLADKHNLEWQGDLWDVKLDYEEALLLLQEFDFTIFSAKFSIDQEVLPKNILIRYKVRIKSKGLIWIVHKYDKDPFPSNPHAHQLDNNIKLDLSNGKCFKIREHVHTLKKKDLILIREEAKKVFDGELPTLEI